MPLKSIFSLTKRKPKHDPSHGRTQFALDDQHRSTGDGGSRSAGAAPSGILQGANRFVMQQPTFMDSPTIIQNIDKGRQVLEILVVEAISDAGMDSSARHPPPLCHPRTRVRLTHDIEAWVEDEDSKRSWNMLWLYGPAGVGKSAVAQTIAEHFAERRRLGAAFFFSRPAKRNDPKRVFITIAYQIAVRIPQYKQLISELLADEPDLLRKAPRIQFKKLIVEPMSTLRLEKPLLIVLDGLDECEGEDVQCEIIELINSSVCSITPLPILWMICSRPEAHLRKMLTRVDFELHCWKEELPVDSEESRGDVALYIREGFKDIHEKYRDCVDEAADGSWPPDDKVSQIIDAASGLFIFASTILKFVGDSTSANPEAQLKVVMSLVNYSRVIGARNPMEALDLLYTRVLSEVPPDTLPVVLKVLHLLLSGFNENLKTSPVQVLCNVLGVSRSEFYTAFRKLHSVLDIPSPEDATKQPLRFFHASFGDYLVDSVRSRIYSLDPPKIALETAKGCLEHLTSPSSLQTTKPCRLTWPVSDGNRARLSGIVRDTALDTILAACPKIGDSADSVLLGMMKDIDFRFKLGGYVRLEDFEPFRRWLMSLTRLPELDEVIRTKRKFKGDYRGTFCVMNDHELLPIGHSTRRDYFLIGYEQNTVIAVSSGVVSFLSS